MELLRAISSYFELFELFPSIPSFPTFFTFTTFPTFPTFPTLLLSPLYRSLGGYGVWGSDYSPRITNMILEVIRLPKLFDSTRIRIVNQSCPPKNTLTPHRGLGGLGSLICGTPISHIMGGLESVENLGI